MSPYTSEQSAYLVQFLHPQKMLSALPGASALDDLMLAGLFGLTIDTYRAVTTELTASARLAAEDLLTDASFADLVDALPFEPGSTIVGLGDSITDDIQSWLEILRHLLLLRRAGDYIRIVNAGLSGDTTTQMANRFLDVVAQRPDWIICLAGSNDVRRSRVLPNTCLVSLQETDKNLQFLRGIAAARTDARWVWVTPPPVIEQQIVGHWWFSLTQVIYRNDDLRAIADNILQQPDPAIDIWRVFDYPARPELLLPDGLHPSLAGQTAIVRAVVELLAE